jgi:hypothetical protein
MYQDLKRYCHTETSTATGLDTELDMNMNVDNNMKENFNVLID